MSRVDPDQWTGSSHGLIPDRPSLAGVVNMPFSCLEHLMVEYDFLCTRQAKYHE